MPELLHVTAHCPSLEAREVASAGIWKPSIQFLELSTGNWLYVGYLRATWHWTVSTGTSTCVLSMPSENPNLVLCLMLSDLLLSLLMRRLSSFPLFWTRLRTFIWYSLTSHWRHLFTSPSPSSVIVLQLHLETCCNVTAGVKMPILRRGGATSTILSIAWFWGWVFSRLTGNDSLSPFFPFVPTVVWQWILVFPMHFSLQCLKWSIWIHSSMAVTFLPVPPWCFPILWTNEGSWDASWLREHEVMHT